MVIIRVSLETGNQLNLGVRKERWPGLMTIPSVDQS